MARPTRRSGNLPVEATSFIGRRRELADLRRKLGEGRLVSLVGPGGVGKTRLAIRAATDLARGFRDGAWLVELGEIQDSGLVDNAVIAAAGVRVMATSREVLAVPGEHVVPVPPLELPSAHADEPLARLRQNEA